MAVSVAILEIFSVKKWPDLEIWVWGRDVHGNGIPNGTGNPMGIGIKHRIGNGNGKLPQWEWELPALPWEFIPKGFMLR